MELSRPALWGGGGERGGGAGAFRPTPPPPRGTQPNKPLRVGGCSAQIHKLRWRPDVQTWGLDLSSAIPSLRASRHIHFYHLPGAVGVPVTDPQGASLPQPSHGATAFPFPQ